MKRALDSRLSAQRAADRHRERTVRQATSAGIDFTSNDYLGFSRHPEIIKAFTEAAGTYGVGAAASQIVTGHTALHAECEAAFANFFQRDRALLFSSGYLANLGVVDAMATARTVIYQDRYNHASLLDAARLSAGSLRRYRHQDTDDLAEKIQAQGADEVLVSTDGVFSIWGDTAPVAALAQVANAHAGILLVDDAHGAGVSGPQGRGTVAAAGLSQDEAPLIVCPLGKAFGTYGAIVAGSDLLIDTLIQFARTYTYTTAIPPALAAAATESLAQVKAADPARAHLARLVTYCQSEAKRRGMRIKPSNSPIQAIEQPDNASALATCAHLKTQGILAYPMRPPTTPKQEALIRIILTAQHHTSEIDQLFDALQSAA